MADRREKAVATAHEYHQGTIASLDAAMTRRLVASTVLTESNGGDLAITSKQGYVGRYQAGAGWLAEAGYVDKHKLDAAMKHDGFDPENTRGAEWKWASSGGMTRFLDDKSNWNRDLSLERYKASPELQDQAFKSTCDKAYAQALKDGVLNEGSKAETVAGFLKAQHVAGYGVAKAAVTGGRVTRDANGTSNYDYLHDITRNRDGLNQLLARDPKTHAALKPAEQTPLLSNPAHPDHALYKSALAGVEKLGPNAFKNRDEVERAAATLASEAKVGGLKTIDHVVPNGDGSGLFAVQGALDDPGHRRVQVAKSQAANQPVEQSSLQAAQDASQLAAPTPEHKSRSHNA